MTLPQGISRIFLSLVCFSTFFALAVAENQPAGTHASHAARTQLTCVASTLQLGEVTVGHTSDKLMTITNSGGAPLVIRSAVSTGTEFAVNGLDLPLTLAAGESFTFHVMFVPRTGGPANGSISILSEEPKQTLTIQLTGTGRMTGQLQVSPATIDFGDASVGPPATQMGQLTASGGSVTVSSATISSANFQLGGLSLPVMIPAGHGLPFTVTPVSQDRSASSAIISFGSDAKNSRAEEAVAVRVSRAAQYKVQLSWKASTSKHILGYNVYRGNRSGGPYTKINDSLDPNTRFTDLSVTAGHKYYYVATAVNSRKRQSPHSKQIRVVIP